MATNTIKTKIKHLTDPSSSYVPLKGELIFLSSGLGGSGGTIKFGDGTKTVANLTAIDANYAVTAGSVSWSGITSKPSYYDAKAIKSITRSETTFTWTCLDGTTGTFTQQDNNTTYSAGTGLSLSGTTFSLNAAATKTALGLGSAAYTASTAYAAASHDHDYIHGTYTRDGGQQPPSYIGTHALKCNMMNGFVGSGYSIPGYMDTLLMNAYSWSDVPYATALGILKTNSTTPRAWIACGPNGDSWTGVAELLTDKNYTNYTLPLTGGQLYGTLYVGNSYFSDETLALSNVDDDNNIDMLYLEIDKGLSYSGMQIGSKNILTWQFTDYAPYGRIMKNIQLNGNAATASAWASAQTLTLAGDLSGSVSIKGNAAMTLTATVKDDSHNHSNYAAKDCNIQEYTFDLSSYSTNNYYLFYFPTDDWDLNCEIKSPNVSGGNAYNQNHIHFILLAQGWSDTPKILNILYSGCYSANEITIMGILVGGKNGNNAIAVRGGMKYRLRCNKVPILKTSTFTDGNETFICGGTSWSGGDSTSVIWANDGINKAYTTIPFYGAVWN